MKKKHEYLDAVKNSAGVKNQDIMMKLTVREIAISLLYMNEDEKKIIFSNLPEPKITRILEEMEFNKNLDISLFLYDSIVDKILRHYRDESRVYSHSSYIRPKKFN